jgi:hypothetical protein
MVPGTLLYPACHSHLTSTNAPCSPPPPYHNMNYKWILTRSKVLQIEASLQENDKLKALEADA